jgi:hypothetical protein
MPAIIDSAPSCIVHIGHAVTGDDADAILQAGYAKCAGIMTFGPGSTYDTTGHSATGAYYAVTWIGIAVTVAVLIAWVIVENRRLLAHSERLTSMTSNAPPGA